MKGEKRNGFDAVSFTALKKTEFAGKFLGVMNGTAITHCMEHKIPILVLNLWDKTALTQALYGHNVGTLVHA